MTNGADRSSRGGAVLVMNPRSGGGKVARFRLVEQARAAGAQVRLTAQTRTRRHWPGLPSPKGYAFSASPAATARWPRWPRWPPQRDGRSW